MGLILNKYNAEAGLAVDRRERKSGIRAVQRERGFPISQE
jgi:hypothetical protein